MRRRLQTRVEPSSNRRHNLHAERLRGILGAARAGDVSLLRKYLNGGTSVDTREDNGYTVLQHAVMGGHAEAVGLILRRRPKVNLVVNGETALLMAARRGDQSLIRMLLKAGARVSSRATPHDSYPLLAAADSSKDDEAVIQLLNAGASIRAVDTIGQCALHKAARGSSVAVVQALLRAGAAANATDSQGCTPLHLAVEVPREMAGHLLRPRSDIARALLSAGADANARTEDGTAPLHVAIMSRAADAVGFLLDAGADINARDGDGWVPLMGAAYDGDPDIVRVLLRRGASVVSPAADYGNALQAAAIEGNVRVVRVLMESGVDADIVGGEFGSPLKAAAFHGRLNVVRNLVSRGARIDASGGKHATAIQAAEAGRRRAVADWLRGWQAGTVTLSGDQETVTKRVDLGEDDPDGYGEGVEEGQEWEE